MIELGRIEALFRYPVKSMRGEPLEAAALGWHGLEGDRRLALRRVDERGGFPWLTGCKLPELIHFTPRGELVVTPEGEELPLFGEALAGEVGRRYGARVEMMRLDQGIFDNATLSVITGATVDEVCRLAGRAGDVRRFRPNVFMASVRGVAFEEDEWVGGSLVFGDGEEGEEEGRPVVAVTRRDDRCAMVNFDPDGGSAAPEVMKAVVKANENNAGVYGTVVRTGRLEVGQRVFLRRG